MLFFFSFPVEEWRSKWFLERRWQKCGTDELIKAMNDINDHVRLAAVSACSKAAELRQIKKDKHHLGKHTLHVCVAVLTPVWKFGCVVTQGCCNNQHLLLHLYQVQKSKNIIFFLVF